MYVGPPDAKATLGDNQLGLTPRIIINTNAQDPVERIPDLGIQNLSTQIDKETLDSMYAEDMSL